MRVGSQVFGRPSDWLGSFLRGCWQVVLAKAFASLSVCRLDWAWGLAGVDRLVFWRKRAMCSSEGLLNLCAANICFLWGLCCCGYVLRAWACPVDLRRFGKLV
jgi:hypothetical protein